VGDVEGMARAAIELLGDPARWQAASTLAIADARARFSLEEVVGQYESFYRRALEGALR
jgi:glycosyltransferase involved in cell wall biosynthesis